MCFKIVLAAVVGHWKEHALARSDSVFTTGFAAGLWATVDTGDVGISR